jgi:hypothetical protein
MKKRSKVENPESLFLVFGTGFFMLHPDDKKPKTYKQTDGHQIFFFVRAEENFKLSQMK